MQNEPIVTGEFRSGSPMLSRQALIRFLIAVALTVLDAYALTQLFGVGVFSSFDEVETFDVTVLIGVMVVTLMRVWQSSLGSLARLSGRTTERQGEPADFV